MPVIHVWYDEKKVTDKDVLALSKATQKIVSEATKIEDVFVYANHANISVQIAPIEIFVQMSAHKVKDQEKLVGEMKSALAAWKKSTGFKHLINFTFTPMQWKIEIGI